MAASALVSYRDKDGYPHVIQSPPRRGRRCEWLLKDSGSKDTKKKERKGVKGWGEEIGVSRGSIKKDQLLTI